MTWLHTLSEWVQTLRHPPYPVSGSVLYTGFGSPTWELQQWQAGAWGRVGEVAERSQVLGIQGPGLYRIIQYDYLEWGRGQAAGIPFQVVGETPCFVSGYGPVALVGE